VIIIPSSKLQSAITIAAASDMFVGILPQYQSW
jgi:hypothetical protein